MKYWEFVIVKKVECSNIRSIFFQNDAIKLGSGKWACPHCSKIMAARSKIQAHILIHTGEKPFACQSCEYVCNRKGSLDRHSKALH